MKEIDFNALEAFGDVLDEWAQPRPANMSSLMNSLFVSGRTLDVRPRIDGVPVLVAAMFDDDTPTIYTTKASPRRANFEQAVGVAHILLQMRERLPETPCRQFLEPHFDLLPMVGDGKARWVEMMSYANPSEAQLAHIAAMRLAAAIVMPRVRCQDAARLWPDVSAGELQRRCNLFLPDAFVELRCKTLCAMPPMVQNQ